MGVQHQISRKLDHFIILDVSSQYAFLEAMILPSMDLDHWPIRLEIDLKEVPKNYPFIFESFRSRSIGFVNNLKQWCGEIEVEGNSLMEWFQKKLNELNFKIKSWNKKEFGIVV